MSKKLKEAVSMQGIITNSADAEIASRCLLQFYFIESAVLFGSFVEGKQNKMSDIDIGIVAMKDLSLIEIGLIASRMEIALKRRVDIVILNDLYTKKPVLAYKILSKGKVLFCRNRERLIELKTNTILSFLDTAPLRDAVNRSLRERMRSGRFGDRNYAG
ncbi:MAG: nucleotidyltransferase domain-containing protein [Deltaproteobacteria bacterium]|nr:nucleotidyltransferase domain-containing protein [Deltaproteobacteria bacterium]